jgi:cbb3-type cytochrome oxidase subunit 3
VLSTATTMHVLSIVVGVLLVLTMVSDAVTTLIVTRGRSAPWRPTRIWYAGSWRAARAVAARLPVVGGESALSLYPAVSLLGLLLIWLAGLMLGWSLLYWGLKFSVDGASNFGTILYYAGTALLTPAFGTAHGAAQRTLTLIETLTGLGTIALLISYLPALYGAYSKREARLLTLDDPLGARITPVRVIAVHSGDGELDLLYRFFAEWEMWMAEVLESHVSYPMLALFRSQHRGQSWITALGVVTDAATLTCACVKGADQREPYFAYRRGRRAVMEIADRLHVPAGEPEDWLTVANFEVAWNLLLSLGLPLKEKHQSWEELQVLRNTYGKRLQELMDFLVAPRGFWGHSAEETVAQEVDQSTSDAYRRARAKKRR